MTRTSGAAHRKDGGRDARRRTAARRPARDGRLGALDWLRAGEVTAAATVFYGCEALQGAPLAGRLERFAREGAMANEAQRSRPHGALDRRDEHGGAREYCSGLAERLAAARL